MATGLFGNELLVCVFGQFPGGKFKAKDDSVVVRAFYNARQKSEFANFFTGCTFDKDGVERTSRTISTALDSLQQSRLLGRMNPDLVLYTISPAMKLRYEMYVKRKVARKIGVVQKFANFIKKELHIDTSS